MKNVFYIAGAGFVAGAVAATAVYLLSSKKKKERVPSYDYKNTGKERVSADNESSTEVAIIPDEPVYEDVKKSAIGSMYSRHELAATVMRNSVETIHENNSVSESTNDEIDKVSAELDKMLRGDER